MNYNWNWGILFEDPYLGWLLVGAGWTLTLSGVAWLIAMTVGTILGVCRTLGGAPNAIAATYVNVFRNTPLLVQLFLWYFVVPELLPADWGRWLKRDLPHPEFWTSTIAIGLFSGARITEQVRAAIDAVQPGLKQAAKSFGMTVGERYRHVILPIAARIVIPPLTSETLNTIKNSSLALTIGHLELTGMSRQIESYTFQGFEAFAAATAIYMTLSVVVIGLMQTIERRRAIVGLMGGR